MTDYRISLIGNDEQFDRLSGLLFEDAQHIALRRLSIELCRTLKPSVIHLDELVLWEGYIIWYRTAGIGGEWIKARRDEDRDREVCQTYIDQLKEHFAPHTEYLMTHSSEDPNAAG